MKQFYFKDKSGRGYKGKRTAEDLLSWENEEDWDGNPLHDFVANSEPGDKWENASTEITNITD